MFTKGTPKPPGSGKKRGQVNKVTQDARQLFVKIMEGQMAEVETALMEVRDHSAFNYIVCLSKLMPYFMPKQIDIKSDGEQLQAPVIQILPHEAE